jgi:hypothetical protein
LHFQTCYNKNKGKKRGIEMSWENTYQLWNDFENLDTEMRSNLDQLEGNAQN